MKGHGIEKRTGRVINEWNGGKKKKEKKRKTIYCAIIKRSLSMNSRTPDCNLCKRNQKDHLGRLFCNRVPLLARGRGR